MPFNALSELAVFLRGFAAERGWEQFHSPKNLAMALNVEAAELSEHFQSYATPPILHRRRRGNQP